MRGSIRVYFSTSKHLDPLELGIPLEVFRKKRALDLDHEEKDLHFSIFTLKMLKSSNACRLVESLSDSE